MRLLHILIRDCIYSNKNTYNLPLRNNNLFILESPLGYYVCALFAVKLRTLTKWLFYIQNLIFFLFHYRTSTLSTPDPLKLINKTAPSPFPFHISTNHIFVIPLDFYDLKYICLFFESGLQK